MQNQENIWEKRKREQSRKLKEENEKFIKILIERAKMYNFIHGSINYIPTNMERIAQYNSNILHKPFSSLEPQELNGFCYQKIRDHNYDFINSEDIEDNTNDDTNDDDNNITLLKKELRGVMYFIPTDIDCEFVEYMRWIIYDISKLLMFHFPLKFPSSPINKNNINDVMLMICNFIIKLNDNKIKGHNRLAHRINKKNEKELVSFELNKVFGLTNETIKPKIIIRNDRYFRFYNDEDDIYQFVYSDSHPRINAVDLLHSFIKEECLDKMKRDMSVEKTLRICEGVKSFILDKIFEKNCLFKGFDDINNQIRFDPYQIKIIKDYI